MQYRKRLIISLVLLIACFLTAPAYSASKSPFAVNADKLPLLALEALQSRFPEAAAENVQLESELYFNCDAKPNIAGPSGIETSVLSCKATVNFDVSDTGIEHFYIDGEGHCRVLKPKTATVHVNSDGSSRVHFHPTNVHEGHYIECDDEAITHIALTDQQSPGMGEAFRVDAAGILEMAFGAAIGTFTEIPAEQIVYGDGPGLSVTCNADSGPDGSSINRATIEACSARVRFANEAVRVDYRHVRDGRCMIGKASDWIVVNIDQDGFARVRVNASNGTGRSRTVECNEAFEESPLPLITDTHMAD